jgi:hypothetical protein
VHREVEIYEDSDKVLDEMLAQCSASPDSCPLAHNRTTSELRDAMYKCFNDIKANPLTLSLPTGDGLVIDYSTVRNSLQTALYSPVLWPGITKLYDDVIQGNASGILDYYLGKSPGLDAEAQFGIKCGDVLQYDDNKESIRPILEARHAQSRAIGDTGDLVVTRCAQWRLPAKERYSGDFQVKTKNPLLFIGNTGDPVTPLASARNMSAGFDGSVVVEHGGFGHASILAPASRCTIEALRAYFEDGTLPGNGTVCGIEPQPFGVTSWAEVLEQMPAACPIS